MEKRYYQWFPKLEQSDYLLFIGELEIIVCPVDNCRVCGPIIHSRFGGYIRKGVFHYVEE